MLVCFKSNSIYFNLTMMMIIFSINMASINSRDLVQVSYKILEPSINFLINSIVDIIITIIVTHTFSSRWKEYVAYRHRKLE